jgi:hypothetical protein
MRIFADKTGTPIETVGGLGPAKGPEGTVIILQFDEETNPGLARLIGEQVEWPFIVITADSLSWHEKPIPINPDSDQRNEEKERQALIDRLFDESGRISDEDLLSLLQLLAGRAGFRPTPVAEDGAITAATK